MMKEQVEPPGFRRIPEQDRCVCCSHVFNEWWAKCKKHNYYLAPWVGVFYICDDFEKQDETEV
jgi:hypothetical protein